MSFWNSVKGVVGIQKKPQQQPPMMVNVPLSSLSPEQQQIFAGTAQPMMKPKKGPMMITRIWKALNTPMVGRRSPGYQQQKVMRGPQPLIYPLPPVDRSKERGGIW